MDKDKSQLEHSSSLHNKNIPENAKQQHLGHISEHKQSDADAEMDALETRLFAMAGSR